MSVQFFHRNGSMGDFEYFCEHQKYRLKPKRCFWDQSIQPLLRIVFIKVGKIPRLFNPGNNSLTDKWADDSNYCLISDLQYMAYTWFLYHTSRTWPIRYLLLGKKCIMSSNWWIKITNWQKLNYLRPGITRVSHSLILQRDVHQAFFQ